MLGIKPISHSGYFLWTCAPYLFVEIMRRLGFSLIELLVVIGIIAILMGILFPVVGRARAQAVAVQCASNLRQIAIGWRTYAEANKGLSVPARMPLIKGTRNLYDIGQGPSYRPRWYELLAAQGKQFAFPEAVPADDDAKLIVNPVFLCPSEPEWTNSRNYVYGYNHQFLGNAREKKPGKYINYPVNSSRIRAAITVLAADSMGTAAGKSANARHAYQQDGTHDLWAIANHGYVIDPPRLTPKSDYAEANHREAKHRSAPDPRHRGKANFAYCDGHVELQALHDVGYNIGAVSGKVDIDGRNNNFSGTGNDEDPPTAM
jgi:prepilin-type processing-associated H-X9-DG protein/prepilin-type N-terminal cleavage/methylation domain-containing protein